MSLKIEPLQKEDLPLLVTISRQTFYDTFHAQNSKEDLQLFLDEQLSPEKLQREFLQPANHFFFAKDNDEIAGYIKLSTDVAEFDEKDAVEISRIYVVTEKLGAGVGKALMLFAIDFAARLNKKAIFLGVWEHNQRAIAFYQKFGFAIIGQHVFMVGNDPQIDWLMKLEL